MEIYIIHLVFVVGLTSQSITTDQLSQLALRNIGPSVTGGRIHDVESLPDNPSVVFIATASGGIWKSSKGKTILNSVSIRKIINGVNLNAKIFDKYNS